MVKRTFDIVVSLLGMILLSPYFLLVAILIKLESPGPVLYRGQRVGYKGRVFTMYKFRTMVVDAERMGPSVTYDEDPRITRVGRLLRSARLDEFPQLWNILIGDMSFVGPRPESIYYYERYTAEQKRIFDVRPGLTCISQVIVRREEDWLKNPATVDRDYLEKVLPPKVKLDLYYMENQSFWLDVFIILQTIWVLIKDRFVEPSMSEVMPMQTPD